MTPLPCRQPLHPPPRYDDAEPFQDMKYCELSDRKEKVVAVREIETGRVEECTHCGEERISPFTRTHSGVE